MLLQALPMRFVLVAMDRFNPNEPRDADGKWTSGGGSSKAAPIKDDNGKPKMLYHATVHDFDAFDLAHGGKNTGSGYSGTDKAVYFAGSATEAGHYAEVGAAQGISSNEARTIKAHVNVTNPLVMDDEKHADIFDNDGAAIDYAMQNGFDAVIWPEGNLVNSGYTVAVFDTSQIDIKDHDRRPPSKVDPEKIISDLKEVVDGDLLDGPRFHELVDAGYVNENTGIPTKKGFAFLKKHGKD